MICLSILNIVLRFDQKYILHHITRSTFAHALSFSISCLSIAYIHITHIQHTWRQHTFARTQNSQHMLHAFNSLSLIHPHPLHLSLTLSHIRKRPSQLKSLFINSLLLLQIKKNEFDKLFMHVFSHSVLFSPWKSWPFLCYALLFVAVWFFIFVAFFFRSLLCERLFILFARFYWSIGKIGVRARVCVECWAITHIFAWLSFKSICQEKLHPSFVAKHHFEGVPSIRRDFRCSRSLISFFLLKIDCRTSVIFHWMWC